MCPSHLIDLRNDPSGVEAPAAGWRGAPRGGEAPMIFYKKRWMRRGGRFRDVWLAAHGLRSLPADREHLVDVSADLAQLLNPPPQRPPASLRLASALVLGTARRAREIANDLLQRCSVVLEKLETRKHIETDIDETGENLGPERTSQDESMNCDPTESLEEQSRSNAECSDDIANEPNPHSEGSYQSEELDNSNETVDSDDGGESHTAADYINRTYSVKSPHFVFSEDNERVSPIISTVPFPRQSDEKLPASPIIGSSSRVTKHRHKAYCPSPVIRYRYQNKDVTSPIIGRKYQVRRGIMSQQYDLPRTQPSTQQSPPRETGSLAPNGQSADKSASDAPRLSTGDAMRLDATETGDTTVMHTIQIETEQSPEMQSLQTNTEGSLELSTIQTNMEFSPENSMTNKETAVSVSMQTGCTETRDTIYTENRVSSNLNVMHTGPLTSADADTTFMEMETPCKSPARLEVSLPKGVRGVGTAPSTRRRRRVRRPRDAWYHTKARATRHSPPLTRSRRSQCADESSSKILLSPSRVDHQGTPATTSTPRAHHLSPREENSRAYHLSPEMEHSISLSPMHRDDLSSIYGDDDGHELSSPRQNIADRMQTISETPLHLDDQLMRRVPESSVNITFRGTMSRESISKRRSASTPLPKNNVSKMSTPSDYFENVQEVVNVEIHEPPVHAYAMPAQRNVIFKRVSISPTRPSSVTDLASDEELEMLSWTNNEKYFSQNMVETDYMEADPSRHLPSIDSEGDTAGETSDLDINEEQRIEEHEPNPSEHRNSDIIDEESVTSDRIEDIPRYVCRDLSTITEEISPISQNKVSEEADNTEEENDEMDIEKETENNYFNEGEIEAENSQYSSQEGGSERQVRNSIQYHQDATMIDGLDISTDQDSLNSDQGVSDGSVSSKTSKEFHCKMDIFPKGEHIESKQVIQVFCRLSKFSRLNKQVKEFWKERERK